MALTKAFKSYDSINHITGCYQSKYAGGTHVITEKIHGSNFSFICNGQSILCAKHGSVLTPNDSPLFHNYLNLLKKYHDQIYKIHSLIAHKNKVTLVTIFGEICGGGYPSIKEPKTLDSIGVNKPVQKGIHYCPHVDFYAFDIYLPEKKAFLPYFQIIELFKECNFRYAKPLFIGSVDEVNAWSIKDLKSAFYKEFNLHEVPDNFVEGVVIRSNDQGLKLVEEKDRQIIKKIHKKFREKIGNPNPDKYEKPCDLKDDFKTLFAKAEKEIVTYVTTNRLIHVITKHGPINKKEKLLPKITGLFVQDALNDFVKDNTILWDYFEKSDKDKLNSLVNDCAKVIINNEKNNILNDNLELGTSNVDTHIMECCEPWFTYIKEGTKTVEGRKGTPNWKKIKVGDIITFVNEQKQQFNVSVTGVNVYKTEKGKSALEWYLKKETLQRTLPDPNIQTFEDGLKVYQQWSSKTEIDKYGFLGIQLSL